MLDPARLQEFFYLARERFSIKLRRERGEAPPWTTDPLLRDYHFCNVFRRDDRTSIIAQRFQREAPTQDEQLFRAIATRVVNKAETIAEWKGPLEQILHSIGPGKTNTNAYRINTPRGLNSFEGMREIIAQAHSKREALARRLCTVHTTKEAHEVLLTASTGFIAYQVLLDLLDNQFWARTLEEDWCWIGPGATIGINYLSTGELRRFKEGRTFSATAKEFQQFFPIVNHLLELSRRPEYWPTDWPEWTLHEVQFMLCEYDKYVKRGQGVQHGRKYRHKT